jgi:cysteine-rich repeat protein
MKTKHENKTKRFIFPARWALCGLVCFGAFSIPWFLGCDVRFGEKVAPADGGTDGGPAVCGNGVLEPGEVCDATDLGGQTCTSAVGHAQGELGCTAQCKLDLSDCSTCGDGLLDGSETCDDGGTDPEDGCGADCRMEPGWVCNGEPSQCNFTCGNGQLDEGETCDDGNMAGGDGCSASCAEEQGWDCQGVPTTCIPLCGDGLLVGSEECDDGNGQDGDGCSTHCQTEHGYTCTGEPSVCAVVCGDGMIGGTEACDDGNTDGGDGCSASCAMENGYVCDDEPSNCRPICGDAMIVGAEECDDGNAQDDDGCSAQCTIEAFTACHGAPSICRCVVYVNGASISGDRTGARWSQALASVQNGVETAVNQTGTCEVWVAAGTYAVYETSVYDTIDLYSESQIYGGFAGNETARSERDWTLNVTVLDGTNPTSPDFGTRHVVSVQGAQDVIFDGFTVTGGGGPQSNHGGAGLFADNAVLEIRNCTFVDNQGEHGGAMELEGSTSTVTDCTFVQNATTTQQAGDSDEDGGAVLVHWGQATFERCTFKQNSANDDGGAMNISAADVTINACVFEDNTTADEGGGVAAVTTHSPLISDTVFYGNTASRGGGLEADRASFDVENTLFVNNQADEGGGAMDFTNAHSNFRNCLFYGNSALDGPQGGALRVVGANTEVVNTIVWGNTPNQFSINSGSLQVSYTIVENGWAGSNVSAADPLLSDPASEDYHLLTGSPAIDAADGSEAPANDRAGNGRVDDPATPNTGAGDPPYVDIGPYEFQP